MAGRRLLGAFRCFSGAFWGVVGCVLGEVEALFPERRRYGVEGCCKLKRARDGAGQPAGGQGALRVGIWRIWASAGLCCC